MAPPVRKVPRTFRLPPELDAALVVEAEVRGVDRTAVVVWALERALGEGSGAGSGVLGGAVGSAGSGSSLSVCGAVEGAGRVREQDGLVSLPHWLSRRLGKPVSLCRAYISLGMVGLGGATVVSEDVAGEDLLRGVTVGGELV